MVEDAEWLSLDPGEELVWWGQPRVRRILPAVAKALFWAAVFLAAAVVGPQFAPPDVPPLAVTAGGVLLAVAALGSAVAAYVRTRNVYYVLTDRNVYRKRGVLSTSVTRVGVANVQNTQLRKHPLGNLFDYGTVEVSSAGTGGADLVLRDLDDPETLREALQRVLAEARQRRPGNESLEARGLDGAAVDVLLGEVRGMRETAERLEEAIAG